MISIYLCTYNGARYIKKQLKSIFNQTVRADEVLISDDSSTDGTFEVVEHFIKIHQLESSWHILKNDPPLGYPQNFYEGIRRCKNEFIFFADQDDIWVPQKIEIMINQMNKNPKINLLACDYYAIDKNDKKIRSVIIPNFDISVGKIRRITLETILYQFRWVGMGMVVRKSWAIEYVDQAAKNSVPHDFLFAVLASISDSFYESCFIGVYHRRHENNTAKEEHLIKNLIDKERLLQDLCNYANMLDETAQIIACKFPKHKSLILHKKEQVCKRYDVVSRCAWREYLGYIVVNWRYLRFPSVIRDLWTMNR